MKLNSEQRIFIRFAQPGKRGEERMWYTLDSKAQHTVRQRTRNVAFTREHGRSSKDVVMLRGLMTMEDYLHFFESVAPLVFRGGILHPEVTVTYHIPFTFSVLLVFTLW